MVLKLYLFLFLCLRVTNGKDEETEKSISDGEGHIDVSVDDDNDDTDKRMIDFLLPIPPQRRDFPEKDKLEQSIIDVPIITHVRLPNVKGITAGHERVIELISGMKRTLRTLSVEPAVFEVKDFFDEDECELLIELAKRKKMSDLHDSDIDIIIHGAPEKTFSVWDLNGDGFVDVEEMALVPGKNMRMTEEDADDMFFMLKMDKNNDGKVDLQELTDTDLSKIQNYLEELKMQPDRERKMKTTATWVWHDEDELLRFQDEFFDGYHSRIASVTGLPEEIIAESEPLQVQHFSESQFSQCRRDSDEHSDKRCCQYGESTNCRLCRYISMAVFLNDVHEGGELVFPLADHEYSNIENGTGEWRGYFTYAKTTGGKNRFTVDIKIVKSGANRLILGDGSDSAGKFEIRDGIILGSTVKFQKVYISTPAQDTFISYSGKVISGSRILGNWWVPGKPRVYGTFFMWNRNYDTLMKTSNAKCNHERHCPRNGLVIKPERGKAIFWYNHHHNHETGMVGERNDDALHGHCAVTKGDKWLATTWLNVIGDGTDELRAWKRGINWLQNKDKHRNIFHKMGSNASRDTIEDYKKEFEKFRFEEIKNENKTVKHEKNSIRKKPSAVLNAVSSLLDIVDKKGLEQIANVVHKKLSLTCVPYLVEEDGKLTLKDGSKAN